MKFLKSISALAVAMLSCLLLSATAFADGPVNPYFEEARSLIVGRRLRETYDLSIDLSFPSNVQTGQTITIMAEASGGSGNYSYKFEIATLDADFPGYLKPHFFQEEYVESNSVTFTFWVPGNYYVWARAIDNEDHSKIGNTMPAIFTDSYNVVATGEDYLASRIAQIVSECPSGNNFERALWLHDYIINHAEYDHGYNYYTADGLLLNGTAVCDGYSRAYNLLLAEAGIGYARVESASHAWNAVELAEGEWYHVDTTWDDPGGSDTPDYYFFGLPTEIISNVRSHVPDYERDCFFPDCVSYDSNYYIKSDEMTWQDSVVSAVEDELNSGERAFALSLSDKISDITYTIPYLVISCGLSRYILIRDGMEYRNRQMVISVDNYDFASPLSMPIEAHYPLNETDMVINLPANLGALEQQSLQHTAAVVVMIPDGCEEIASLALADISDLDEVHIPASVTDIASDAFSNCKPNLLIVTPKNSSAATFADDKGFCVEYTA